jgi:hypothetical protein
VNHQERPPAWNDTLAGLVRLLLVVLAVPAVLIGCAAALVVLVASAPFVLVFRLVRWSRTGRQGSRLQVWGAL